MKHFLALILSTITFLFVVFPALAVENPLSVTNNKVGIHILFPSELEKAATLVNSNGGDWGYVVIPIQSGDKDLVKWQAFMDDCRKYHVIPLIRLATEGDYFNTKVWRKPTPADVMDFANFLNSLSFPTKNKYIIVYNEVNRADEWGGDVSPSEYANLLSYAVTAFKQRDSNFFIISSGMDNAAANTQESMNEYNYFYAMNTAVPGIFNQIDGMSSHSYPNPGFSSLPSMVNRESIASFSFEDNLLTSLSSKTLPVFITETGWDQNAVGVANAASFLTTAFQNTWNTSNIVTVAPFLLQAGGGPFTQFSLFDANGAPNAVYQSLQNVPKSKGAPVINQDVLAANTVLAVNLPVQHFTNEKEKSVDPILLSGFKTIAKWLLRM